MINKIIEMLKEKDYKTYFLISWIFSYILIHIGTDIEYSGNFILKYQPATAIILVLTYAYTEVLYFGSLRAKGQKTIKDSAINAIKCAVKILIFVKIMYLICSFAYENGIDLWFLWGDSPN